MDIVLLHMENNNKMKIIKARLSIENGFNYMSVNL